MSTFHQIEMNAGCYHALRIKDLGGFCPPRRTLRIYPVALVGLKSDGFDFRDRLAAPEGWRPLIDATLIKHDLSEIVGWRFCWRRDS